jgi:hypothetical protein
MDNDSRFSLKTPSHVTIEQPSRTFQDILARLDALERACAVLRCDIQALEGRGMSDGLRKARQLRRNPDKE